MTAKKSLKRHARERQKVTGERYTSALAHVLAGSGPMATQIAELHDVSSDAELEGVHCRVVVSDELWRAETLGPGEHRFRAVFERLRALVHALEGDRTATALCSAVLRGEVASSGVPNAIHEITESQRFLTQVRSGVRGASRNGRMVGFDVETGFGKLTILGVLLAAPIPRRRPLLWLTTFSQHETASSKGLGAELAKHLALAGLGGPDAGGKP